MATINKSSFTYYDQKRRVWRWAGEGDPRDAIRFLKKIRTDYDGYDLRKPITPNTKRKIARDMGNYFSLVKSRPDAVLYTPTKANRKLAADRAGMSKKYKTYLLPGVYASAEGADRGMVKTRVVKRGGKKVLIQSTPLADYFTIPLNPYRLAIEENEDGEENDISSVEAYLWEVLAPYDRPGFQFKLNLGTNVSLATYRKAHLVVQAILKMLNQYATTDFIKGITVIQAHGVTTKAKKKNQKRKGKADDARRSRNRLRN